MIGCAVALDSRKETVGIIRVCDAEVDPIPGHSDLRFDCEPGRFELGLDVFFERTLGRGTDHCSSLNLSSCRVLKVIPQHPCTCRNAGSEKNITGPHRGEQVDPLARACK